MDGRDEMQIARALGQLEGELRTFRRQNIDQHAQNREAIEAAKRATQAINDKVDALMRAKNIGIGIIAGASLAGGVLGGKLGAILMKWF